ncbi:Genome sequencing data, contig C266 (fragment) [Microcystis aeruginosa PCC 9808]|uniref:Genome sequencing data, contig C266 n=1 Tax=Microcystis aeruginosa PCC 9808 TaxID=1160284 RepID=I4HI04_MICAE
MPEDVFSWVRGEYSLALVPSSKGMEPDSVFLGERVMGVEVDSAIANLAELARSRGYNVVTRMTAWTKLTTAVPGGKAQLETLVTGVHTRVDNYEIIASSVEAMGLALSAQKNPILSSGKFRQAITALPAENDGYFYVDWRQLQPVIEAKFPIVRVLELSIKPLFNNLRSLTISSQGSENSVRRGTIFFNLGVKS